MRTILAIFAALLLLRPPGANAQSITTVEDVDTLFREIYSLRISRSAATALVRQARAVLRERCERLHIQPTPATAWVFPLRGYSPAAIGGRGAGYRGAAGYDFFAGNAHGGHPAHDLFIRDRNFDDFDDRTLKAVEVLSLCSGIVACVNPVWSPDSVDAKGVVLRGGVSVWVYDPYSDGLVYYAHLRSVSCRAGQALRAGDPLGEVGRTGKNAAPHRSPTHLHLMALSFLDGKPVPRDIYNLLVRAHRIK